LGVTVSDVLLDDGLEVRIFDLENQRNRGSVRDLRGRAEIVWGDITRPDSVRRALEDVDLVVHMAGILPPLAYQKPDLARKVNVGGTKLLVDAIKEKGVRIPLIFTSSVAVFGPTPGASEPLSAERNEPRPSGAYGETKLEAENIIRDSGLDHVILRLTAVMYFTHEVSDLKRMYSVPLDTRVEFCHPDDLALAIRNAVRSFEAVKGNTLVVSGGPSGRMLYAEMVGAILGIMGLPLPPADKFTRQPYYLDWYDTSRSQELLDFQRRSFSDYLADYARELSRKYTAFFLPFMRRLVSPVFGRAVVRFI